MKKILAIVLSIVMICSILSACGNEDPSSTQTTQPNTNESSTLPNQSQEATNPEEEDEPVVTVPSDIQEVTRPDSTIPDETVPEEQSNKFALGTIKGGVYTNTYVGYKCTLSGRWKFATADELQEIPEDIEELLQNPSWSDYLADHIYDMEATNQADMTVISVSYQKLTSSQKTIYASLTEEEIIDAMIASSEEILNSIENIDISKMEKVHVTFCGKQRPAILSTGSTGGIPYYTLQIVDACLGDYQVITTLGTFRDNNTNSLLSLFTPIN